MAELKPCPFCGGKADIVERWPDKFHRMIMCDECGAEFVDKNEHAVAAWNTRAERTCQSTTDDAAWCFVCSECGKSFPRNQLRLAHNHGEINYCPNCGARVVE